MYIYTHINIYVYIYILDAESCLVLTPDFQFSTLDHKSWNPTPKSPAPGQCWTQSRGWSSISWGVITYQCCQI